MKYGVFKVPYLIGLLYGNCFKFNGGKIITLGGGVVILTLQAPCVIVSVVSVRLHLVEPL
jgi:hypothetical protein